jgi:REP element-mobilizing transposase RayT
MGLTYTVKDQTAIYFVTFTVHQWVDVFTRQLYVDILLESIRHCQQQKGLQVYAWVVMSNHCHLIISSTKIPLSDIIRDLKKFTAKKIMLAIRENERESRKSWLLWLLTKDGHTWFWEEGYQGKEIHSHNFLQSKISYIHSNPVRAGIVEKEEEYLNGSCGAFYGLRKSAIPLAEI